MLADRRAESRLEVLFWIEEHGNGAEINRKFADRFAGEQPAGARIREHGREKGKGDIGEAAGGKQRLYAKSRRICLARKAKHEHHRYHGLHANCDGPAAEPSHHAAREGDHANG